MSDERNAAKLALARAVMGDHSEGVAAEEIQVEVAWTESGWEHGCGGDCHPGYETSATIEISLATAGGTWSLEGDDVAKALQRMLIED